MPDPDAYGLQRFVRAVCCAYARAQELEVLPNETEYTASMLRTLEMIKSAR